MKNLVKILALIIISYFIIACEKDDDSSPSIDEDMIGYWFKLTAEDQIAIDVDGYFWGLEIKENGDVTTARLNYSAGTINTEASGPAFRISQAADGNFSGKADEETVTGTYVFGTISNAGWDYNSMTIYSSQITDYLPGGTGGDWSVTGKYALLFNLDGTDASTGESPITDPPKAPSNLTFTRISNGGDVTLTWYDNSETETGFEIERRLYENEDYSKIATTEADDNSYTDNSVETDEVYQYRVSAVNSVGNSAYSNVVVAKGIPKAPWSLTANYNYSTYIATFTWWARYCDDIDHFQFAIYDSGSWTDLSFTFDSNPTGSDQWMETGTMNWSGGEPWPAGTYVFKVKAINSEGESNYSDQVSFVISGKKSTPEILDFLNFSVNEANPY
jgi:hypothetical protein